MVGPHGFFFLSRFLCFFERLSFKCISAFLFSLLLIMAWRGGIQSRVSSDGCERRQWPWRIRIIHFRMWKNTPWGRPFEAVGRPPSPRATFFRGLLYACCLQCQWFHPDFFWIFSSRGVKGIVYFHGEQPPVLHIHLIVSSTYFVGVIAGSSYKFSNKSDNETPSQITPETASTARASRFFHVSPLPAKRT